MTASKERKREKESSKEKEKKRETSNSNSNTVLRKEYTSALLTIFLMSLFSISISSRLAPYFSISNENQGTLSSRAQRSGVERSGYRALIGFASQIPPLAPLGRNDNEGRSLGRNDNEGRSLGRNDNEARRPGRNDKMMAMDGRNDNWTKKLAPYFSISNENKEIHMTESQIRKKMIAAGLSIREGELQRRIIHLEKAIKIAIPPKTQSDRTCFRKVANWIGEKCAKGIFNPEEILSRVIDYALEATNPEVKNPPAVFMHILKKELNYPK